MGAQSHTDQKPAKAIEEVEALIARATELLARASELLTAYKRDEQGALAKLIQRSDQVTDNGRIRGLPASIVAVLDSEGRGMTVSEICDRLYRPGLGITRDLHKRRTIVAISRMHRSNGPVLKVKPEGSSEYQWILKKWMGDPDSAAVDRLGKSRTNLIEKKVASGL